MKNKISSSSSRDNDLRRIAIMLIVDNMKLIIEKLKSNNNDFRTLAMDKTFENAVDSTIAHLSSIKPLTLKQDEIQELDNVFSGFNPTSDTTAKDIKMVSSNAQKIEQMGKILAEFKKNISSSQTVIESDSLAASANPNETSNEHQMQMLDKSVEQRMKELEEKLEKIMKEYLRILYGLHDNKIISAKQ